MPFRRIITPIYRGAGFIIELSLFLFLYVLFHLISDFFLPLSCLFKLRFFKNGRLLLSYDNIHRIEDRLCKVVVLEHLEVLIDWDVTVELLFYSD